MTGDELKEWRQARGATQQDLADTLGVNVATIKRAESSAEPISKMMEMALAQADLTLGGTVTVPVRVAGPAAMRLHRFAAPFGLDRATVAKYFLEKIYPDPIPDGLGLAEWLTQNNIAHTRPEVIERILGPTPKAKDSH